MDRWYLYYRLSLIWLALLVAAFALLLNPLAASFICPYLSPGHHVEGGSLAEILVARSATRWLRLYG